MFFSYSMPEREAARTPANPISASAAPVGVPCRERFSSFVYPPPPPPPDFSCPNPNLTEPCARLLREVTA